MINRITILGFAFLGIATVSCGGGKRPPEVKEKSKPVVVATVPSPHGYDLGSPKKTVLPEALHEISGICFLHKEQDTLYAIEDETGRLFHFHPGDTRYPSWKFGKRGDYEDLAVLNQNEFVVLRSDGTLFVFPAAMVGSADNKGVKVYEHILPKGEYEGLYGNEGRVVALCKNCTVDDKRNEVSGYVLQYDEKKELRVAGHFVVGTAKKKFHPSCLARHPLTKEWYIISSVNRALLVLDEQWRVKESYDLNPGLYKQPEGLAFDAKGNMYISNEGVQGNANVLFFAYRP
jgi:hypothetical protein